MAGTGKFFVGGNWKCNGTKKSINKLVSDLNNANLEPDVDVVVAPPFVYIDQCGTIERYWLQPASVGHSERRHVIGEDDLGPEFATIVNSMTSKKVAA